MRENRIEIARFLIERGADPFGLAVNDSLLDIAKDRGYDDMQHMLESIYASTQGASPKEARSQRPSANASRKKVHGLLDAAPELLQAGDERSNQPIHWAGMTRQIDLVDDLLAGGADINARRQDGARYWNIESAVAHFVFRQAP